VGVAGPLPKSVIVAVHVVDRPANTEPGEHRTVAAVGRPVTATDVDALSTACVESPLYVPLIRCAPGPTAVGVYETVQVPVDPDAARLHRGLLNVPCCALAKLTVPVGAGPLEVSLTVAVHVVDWVAVMDAGAHVVLTAMGRTTVRNVGTVVSSLRKFASSSCTVLAPLGV